MKPHFKMVVSVSSALAFTHMVIVGISETHRSLLELLLTTASLAHIFRFWAGI